LVHKGGGIGQPADPPGNTYFSPILVNNGRLQKSEGYCTDVFTEAALDFIEGHRNEPFFVYLATNTPHTPLQIDESYVAPYRNMDLIDDQRALPAERPFDLDYTARIYGMIENIDENVGRILGKLGELELVDNTIVIFLTDNGPQQWRYNAGLRGRKTQVWEGGIRVPCFFRWPAGFSSNHTIDQIAAHIDLLPTILEACRVPLPADLKIDGRSLLPLLTGAKKEWTDRTLYFQSHRGDEPQLYRNFAARNQRFKIVQPESFVNPPKLSPPPIQLFDISLDPGETKNIAAERPALVQKMMKGYEEWFRDVSSSRGYHPVRIHIGGTPQDPVILTPQDWRGSDSYKEGEFGYYEVLVRETSKYQFRLVFNSPNTAATLHLKIGSLKWSGELPPVTRRKTELRTWTLDPMLIKEGQTRIEAWVSEEGKPRVGVRYIEVSQP
jgi:hypothetical protein